MVVPSSYQKETQISYGLIFIPSQFFYKIIQVTETTLAYIFIHLYIYIILGKLNYKTYDTCKID